MKDYKYKFKCPECGCETLSRFTMHISENSPVYGIEVSEHGCHHGLCKDNYSNLIFDNTEVIYGCYDCSYEADFDDMIKAGHLVLTEELQDQDYN